MFKLFNNNTIPDEAWNGAKLVLPLNTGFLDQDEIYLLDDGRYTINRPEGVNFLTIKIQPKDRELNRVLVIY